MLERGSWRTVPAKQIRSSAGARHLAATFVWATTDGDAGEATESVDAAYSGEPLRIGFNCLFLLDFFSVVKTGQVEIALKDDQSAAEFWPADDGEYRHVIMPMRT